MTTTTTDAVWETSLPGLPPPKRGKVQDVYDLGETLLIIACDPISAYDHVLRPGVPGKGKVLNQLSNFWFARLGHSGSGHQVPNHLLATDPADFPAELGRHRERLAGRPVLVRKAKVVPFECVARGYLAGSAFKEYQRDGRACGIALPAGLQRASRLPEPIFTPATKAESGHDENVSYDHVAKVVGDELLLIDAVFTPDSSRYWDAAAWKPGEEPASFDKQFVRNWLDGSGWEHESTPPPAAPPGARGRRGPRCEAAPT